MPRRPRGPAARPSFIPLGTGQRQNAKNGALEPLTAPKRPKYGNTPTVRNGRRFASKREADRYETLWIKQQQGEITDLRCQVSFPLGCNGITVSVYIADFCYVDAATGEAITEDAKGVRTPLYKLKAKMMLACHGITVREV